MINLSKSNLLIDGRIYSDDSQIKDDEKYQLLMKRLPTIVHEKLLNYHPKIENFEKNLSDLKRTFIYREKTLYKIAKVAVLAYRISRLTFEELASVFMKIGAIEELYLNPKMSSVFVVNGSNSLFHQSIKEINPFFSHPIPKEFIRAAYEVARIHFLKLDDVSEEYLEKINSWGLLNHSLETPLLQEYFALNSEEWALFIELMQKAEESEKDFTLIINNPGFGCWSPIYEMIQKVVRCFKILTIYRVDDLTCPPYEVKEIILPSFTMLQNFLKVKAATYQREAVELTPVLGCLSYDDLAELKQNNQSPFGLYCPTPPAVDPDKTLKHMRVIDGWGGSGPLSFWIHDAYHALRWQEMSPNICKALFYMVNLLDTYGKNLKKGTEDYKNLRRVRNFLIDGELIHSYPNKSSLFVRRPFDVQKFGALLKDKRWSIEFKELILKDIGKNIEFWQERFQISYDDLDQEDQIKCLNYNKESKNN